jgi:hypothetical protein
MEPLNNRVQPILEPLGSIFEQRKATAPRCSMLGSHGSVRRKIMIRFARAIVISSTVLAIVAGSAGMIGAQEGDKNAPQPMIGMAAPGFVLQSIGGDTLSLADLRGKFVVIHFGASW